MVMQLERSKAKVLIAELLQRVVWPSVAAVALACDGRIRMLSESLRGFRPKVHPSGC